MPYDAAACSCAPVDPWKAYAESDAAIVGVFEGKPSPTTYRFRVEEDFKAELPAQLDVSSASSGASCGIEAPVGARLGLFLDRTSSGWRSSLCSQARPEQVRAAAAGLPKPDGTGRVRMLIGGNWGGVKVQALDSAGRTLAYGRGPSSVRGLVACRGGHRFVEASLTRVALRDVRTMRVLSAARVPRGWFGARAHCYGGAAYAALFGDDGTRIVRLSSRRTMRLGHGSAQVAAFGGRFAYLAGSRRIWSLDLVTRKTKTLALFTAHDLAVGRGGTRLAVASAGAVSVVDLVSGRIRHGPTLSSRYFGPLVWDGDRLVSVGHPNVWDDRFRVVGKVPQFYAVDAVGLRGRIAAIGYGELRTIRLPRGPVGVHRDLLTAETNAIAAVDQGPRIALTGTLPCARG